MALDTNFNVNPYYDDFNEDKKFLRLLFKPGYAVQARELTQLQTILQKQVERFGDHVFKSGSVVSGGQFFLQDVTYIKLDTNYGANAVTANNFVGATIVDNVANPTKRAEVIKVYDADSGTGDPKTLLVKQIYGDAFTSGSTILTNEASPTYANISSSGVGTGQVFSVNEGVFYYDGFFIKNDAQSVATSKYNNTTASAKIGFEITESTIASTSDTSLLDPAEDASNFQAPGSDRYKIDLVLATRSLASTDTTQFIELARVENGVIVKENKYPIYSVLEETLARRTYDESGNYTIKPFKISLETSTANSANANVILSPGKAYVYGYEIETISPTVIEVGKPRETANVTNKRITADYGYYVYANTLYGTMPIKNFSTIDLHSVSNSSINVSSAGTISNTKIGTARVKSIIYDSSSDSANSKTYEQKIFLFDVDVGSIAGGNCNSTSEFTTNTSYVQLSSGVTSGTLLYSTANNAYRGAKLRITDGPGSSETSKTITNWNGATQIALLSEPFNANVHQGNSQFSIDFEFNDVKSLATHSGTTLINAADVDDRSKDYATIYNDTFITDTAFEPLIFTLGESYVANSTITDVSFSYKKLFEGVSFSGDTTASALSPIASGETLAGAGSTSAILQNYQVTVTAAGTSSFEKGYSVSADLISVDTGAKTITVTGGQNMTANIIATIDVSNPTPKTKTYVAGSSTIQTSGGSDLFGNGAVQLFSSSGQLHISANTIEKVAGTDQSLFTSDVYGIVSILDFNGNTISIANEASAINVTSRYAFDNGQRDSYYDHASIRLIAGNTPPVGPLVVKFNHFASSGDGFFTVDSYVNGGLSYGNIPSYSATNGQIYELRDSLDFRLVRANATTATANSVSFVGTNPQVLENGSDIILDYDYYLPRIDKVVLNKDRTFEVIKGVSSLNPLEPKDKDGSMTMYTLINPAYTADTADIDVSYRNNRRYTMRDIGGIEKRVENLEYYTSLSLLEQDTLNKQDLTILDSTNLPRFKNGIITDSFKGHSVARVTASDYAASIDINVNELRPSFNISAYSLVFDSANSSNYGRTGSAVMASSTSTSFIDQNQATRSINVNPFNVVNYLGKIELDPKTDIWFDETRKPDVLVNIGGDADAWARIIAGSGANAVQLEWGSWQNKWTGTETGTKRVRETSFDFGIPRRIYEDTVVIAKTGQSRTGVSSKVAPETITQSIGDRIVDVSVIPYMRAKNVLFLASDFKPDTVLYPFFDSTSLASYAARANRFILNSNNLVNYQTEVGNPELVYANNITTATSNGTAYIIKSSNNTAFVVSVNPSSSFNFGSDSANLIGATTSTEVEINGYWHYTGNPDSATNNSMVLRQDITGANNEGLLANTSNSNTISIVSGTGAGQEVTITAYDAATRNVTISGTWTTTPDATSVYTIGKLTTNRAGDEAGVLFIPANMFRTGEKRFRLIDNSTGDLGSSSTNGDATFFSQGLLQTKEETNISTVVPTIQRTSVTDERVVSSTTRTGRRIVGYYDPLAQTFLVSPNNFSQGMFLDRVRLCFAAKDEDIPVTLQIRPATNGYPDSSIVYPYGSVTLTPDKVKVTSSPDLDDATKYTEFVFDVPVFLQPGEHSFVLLANSKKYETYIASVGALDLVNGRQVSDQPYGGSLFLSQNGSTWTADQTSDMMFRLFRKSFSTTPATVRFLVDTSDISSNVNYDLLHLMTNESVVSNTSVVYTFKSEKATDGGFVDYKPIIPLENFDMADISRRVLNPTTGNATMSLSASIATLNPDISPVIDTSRFGGFFIENKINNLPLSNNDFVVTTAGSSYSGNAKVTIAGGGGSGANAYANVTASGTVDKIVLDNAGSGYTTSPTVTITDGAGSGAVATYNGEDKKQGGNAEARYITRKVTLADGFDSAGDLRVYMTAYKPSNSNILVYYKVISKSDPEQFDNKNYQLMTELGNENFVSTNSGDYRELVFAPGVGGEANNSISYTSGTTSYNTFKSFAIKIVMTGTSTIDVPKIRDMRAIALPAGN